MFAIKLTPLLQYYGSDYGISAFPIPVQLCNTVVLNNTALTTSTRSNPGHLMPCGSEHEGTISFSQPLRINLTNAILLFILFLVMSSI